MPPAHQTLRQGLQQLLFGFVLTFLGGTFITTIAAWEASF